MSNLISKIAAKSPKELLIIAIITVVIVFVTSNFIYPYFKTKVVDIKYKISGGKKIDGSSIETSSMARKATLAGLSKDLYDSVYSPLYNFADREGPLSALNSLNDAEFIYAFESYLRQFSANPSYDLSLEYFVGPEKDIYIKRAAKLSLPAGEKDITPKDKKG